MSIFDKSASQPLLRQRRCEEANPFRAGSRQVSSSYVPGIKRQDSVGSTMSADAMCVDSGIEAVQALTQSSQSSFKSALLNICMSVLGAGQLTLPYVMNRMGVVLGALAVVGCGCLSVYSCKLLARCSQQTGATTYSELLSILLGEPARKLADVLIAIYAWGGAVSFLIIIKDQLRFLATALALAEREDGMGTTYMVSLSLILILPLSLLRNLDALKFTSGFGAFAAMLIMLAVICTAPWSSHGMALCGLSAEPGEEVKLIANFPLEILETLPLIAFALNSSWAFLNIFATLDVRSRHSGACDALLCLSIGLILLNYLPMAVIGYLSYCESTLPNIMDSMQIFDAGWKSYFVLLIRAVNVLKLAFALPLRFNVARAVLLNWGPTERVTPSYGLLTVGLVSSAVAVAALPVKLNNVIGVTSSICASFIICVFPGSLEIVLMRQSHGEKGTMRAVRALLIVVFGLLLLTTGTYANLKRLLYS